jgi:anti-sigma factor RsiW
MSDVRKDELVRLSMKAELTPDEELKLQACFAANPPLQAEWEQERALSRALQSLPDAPVSSNFTSRVLQATEMEERRGSRERDRSWLRNFMPRLSWALAVAVFALAGIYEYRAVKRTQFANQVRRLDLAHVPAPDVLEDFEAINQLRQVAVTSDEELLKAFQ